MLRALSRWKALSALGGTLFVFGVPYIWHDLRQQDSFFPDALRVTLGEQVFWGVALIAAGLVLLALALLHAAENPYGYFAFGTLPALAAILLDFFLPHSSYLSFPLLLLVYALLIWRDKRGPEPDGAAG